MKHFVDLIYAFFQKHLPFIQRRWSYNLCIFAPDLSIFKSCRYNICIIKTHSPLLLRRCSYNLCIFAQDLSIFRVVDKIYAFLRDTYPYYYGDVAIIYAFSHEICHFLMVVDIIYAFSHQICQF